MADNIPPVDGNGDASGKPDESNEDKRPSYESHQKLLSEKKAIQDKAKRLEEENAEFKRKHSELDRKNQDDERKKLEDKEQFKDLYTKTREELAAKDEKISSLLKAQVDARKMSSFLDAIKGDIPRQYWGLVDIDKIALDGDKVDEFSVQKYVEDFRTTYKDIIKPIDNRRMPSDSPPADDSASNLTYDQWLKLSAKDKEKKINLVK
jgi:hypothetical protein